MKKSQFLAVIGISGESVNNTWTLSVDVDLSDCEKAEESHYDITCEIASKFNKIFSYYRYIYYEDVVIKCICKMK